MRERMKRRKKPSDAKPESTQAPLQPAYYEAEPAQAAPEKPEPEPEPQNLAAEEADTAQGQAGAADATSRPKRRRSRGGRGRGRGRRRTGQTATAEAPSGETAEPATESSLPEAPSTPHAAAPAQQAPSPAPPRPPRGIVVLSIGLPGSGKSSWFKRHKISPLSSDLLRQLLFDDATEQRFQDLVFSNLRSMLKARLIARRPLNYVDATNLSPHERHGWVKLAKDFGYEVHAVFFDVPLDVCLERNAKRNSMVSDDVMRRMSGKLKPPTFEEGFSKITVVRVKPKE